MKLQNNKEFQVVFGSIFNESESGASLKMKKFIVLNKC